jgi:tetratricopeptide (TPR) repeat protein
MTDALLRVRESIEQGNFKEARALAVSALAQAEDVELRARLTHNLCIAMHRAGDHLDALSLITLNLSLFEDAPLVVQANVHNERGIILYHLHQPAEARAEYEIAVRLYEAAGDNLRRAASLNNLALLYAEAREFKEAHRSVRAAREIWTKAKDTPRIAQALDTLARILLLEGRTREAAWANVLALLLLRGSNHQGRVRQARATYRAILQVQQPEHSTVSETPTPSNPARAPQQTRAP